MNRDEIVRLTQEYGGDWGVNHSKRLLHLVSILGEGMDYNEEAVWLAAHLHDWGGYQPWVQQGVEHDVRSTEVAREFLSQNGFDEELSALVLECISCHHGGSPDRSIESILLTDADALDLLGVVGTFRACCMVPRNLKGAYEAVKMWRDRETAAITLEKTKELAEKRVEETNQLLETFVEESFGIF
jgi:uncharacterized protein